MLERSDSDASDPGNEGSASVQRREITAGAALFARLRTLGVDYVFCNSGTDFPPIIEGLAEASAGDVPLPEAIVIPHEHAALGMAHGYYFATGKAQAVILHTNVGLANGAIGAINAATDRVPVILMSGRTPVTEKGRFGARTVPIGWGQEMRDQAALVREACKWDYELRFPEQIGELLDRAHAIANSTPKGPVYLSLPREVLCQTLPAEDLAAPPSMMPARTAADQELIATAARWLSRSPQPAGDRPARRRVRGRIRRAFATCWRNGRSRSANGGRSRPRCRPTIPAMSAPTRNPGFPRPTSSWSSTAWRRGRRTSTRREPTPGSSISGRIRCSRVSRSGTSAQTSRSPARPRDGIVALEAALRRLRDAGAARQPGRAGARRRKSRGDPAECRGERRAKRSDEQGLCLEMPCRGDRRARCRRALRTWLSARLR